MEWAIGIVTGVISGILASAIFFGISYGIRSKVIIGENIARKKIDGRDIFYIKAINCSYFEYIDVTYTLQLVIGDGEYNTQTKVIKPLKDVVPNIDAYASEKKKPRCEYAIRISYDVTDYLKNIEDNDKYPPRFIFTIQGKHELSNSRTVYNQTFFKSNIIEGVFETGKSTKILPQKSFER